MYMSLLYVFSTHCSLKDATWCITGSICHVFSYTVSLELTDFSDFFPLYILKCNKQHIGDRFSPNFQVYFFQHNCHYMMTVEKASLKMGTNSVKFKCHTQSSDTYKLQLMIKSYYTTVEHQTFQSAACIIFINTRVLQTCSWQTNEVLNNSKITPHFHL